MPFISRKNPPPEKQCLYCGDWFALKAINQKICGKHECKLKAQRERLTRSIAKNHERYKEKWREAFQRRYVPKPRPVKQPSTAFIMCPNCLYWVPAGRKYC